MSILRLILHVGLLVFGGALLYDLWWIQSAECYPIYTKIGLTGFLVFLWGAIVTVIEADWN